MQYLVLVLVQLIGVRLKSKLMSHFILRKTWYIVTPIGVFMKRFLMVICFMMTMEIGLMGSLSLNVITFKKEGFEIYMRLNDKICVKI